MKLSWKELVQKYGRKNLVMVFLYNYGDDDRPKYQSQKRAINIANKIGIDYSTPIRPGKHIWISKQDLKDHARVSIHYCFTETKPILQE